MVKTPHDKMLHPGPGDRQKTAGEKRPGRVKTETERKTKYA